MKFNYIIALALVFTSCTEEPTLEVLRGEAFGTSYLIQYYNSEDRNLEKGIDSVIYAVNKSVSTYIPNSDISKINRGDTTVVVDSIFKEVFRISKIVHKKSNGFFDPTVGVLRNAYGFGDSNPVLDMDQKVIDSLMKFVGLDKVSIANNGTILKEYPQIYFDFNAVAKGYAIDCLGRYLESMGVRNYLIELGGEILAKGRNSSSQQPWKVGIEGVDSQLDNRSFQVIIALEDRAMASSGNYRKFRIDSVSGKKYVHTINPLTGSAEQSNVTSATVVMSTCGEADAYATALMALGLERSKQLLNETAGVDAYLTFNDSLGNPQVFMTEDFKKLLVD